MEDIEIPGTNKFVYLSSILKPKISNIFKQSNVSPDSTNETLQVKASEGKNVVIDSLLVQFSHPWSKVSSAPAVSGKTQATFRFEKVFTLQSNVLGLKRELQQRFGGSIDLSEFVIFHESQSPTVEILDHVKLIDLPVTKEMVPANEVNTATSHDSISSNTTSKKKSNLPLVETDRYVLPLTYEIRYSTNEFINYGRLDPLIDQTWTKSESVKDFSHLKKKKTLVNFNPDIHLPDFIDGTVQSKRLVMMRDPKMPPLTIVTTEAKPSQEEELVYDATGKSLRQSRPMKNQQDLGQPKHFQNYFEAKFNEDLKNSFRYAHTSQDLKAGMANLDDCGLYYKWSDYLDGHTSRVTKPVKPASAYPFASILTSEDEVREYYGDDRTDYDDTSVKYLVKSLPNTFARRKEGFGGFKWGLDSFNDIPIKKDVETASLLFVLKNKQ